MTSPPPSPKHHTYIHREPSDLSEGQDSTKFLSSRESWHRDIHPEVYSTYPSSSSHNTGTFFNQLLNSRTQTKDLLEDFCSRQGKALTKLANRLS